MDSSQVGNGDIVRLLLDRGTAVNKKNREVDNQSRRRQLRGIHVDTAIRRPRQTHREPRFVNEDPGARLIRELREELERLRKRGGRFVCVCSRARV